MQWNQPGIALSVLKTFNIMHCCSRKQLDCALHEQLVAEAGADGL